jgi:uncharacterized metal-binding protein
MLTPAYRVFNRGDPGNAVLDTGLLIGAHLLSGMMFSPDLDLDSAIDDRWGAFRWIWWPYTWLIPHRHFWSHGLIVAPLLRLAYFYGVLNLLIFGVAWVLGQQGVIVPNYHERLADALLLLIEQHPNQVLLFLLGFVTGSAAHTAADWLVTGGKRYLARLGYRPRREYLYHDWRLHARQPARRAYRGGRQAMRGW